jgi:hypothetical protein
MASLSFRAVLVIILVVRNRDGCGLVDNLAFHDAVFKGVLLTKLADVFDILGYLEGTEVVACRVADGIVADECPVAVHHLGRFDHVLLSTVKEAEDLLDHGNHLLWMAAQDRVVESLVVTPGIRGVSDVLISGVDVIEFVGHCLEDCVDIFQVHPAGGKMEETVGLKWNICHNRILF